MKSLHQVITNFKIVGTVISVENYGEGHINDTYLVVTKQRDEELRYILQRINNKIFEDIDGLMRNIVGVTEFIRNKVMLNGGNPDRESLTVVPTLNNLNYLVDNDNNFFRCYLFIGEAISLQNAENAYHFYLSGIGFGKFQKYLDGYPASTLTEPIKNFHNTVDRYAKFEQAVKANKADRLDSCKEEVEFYVSRKGYCNKILTLLNSGEIPYRVTHNDTKLNNVLIDTIKNEPVAVLDLDTVMPGAICYDFGDSIRFGANIGVEDERDLSKVGFSLELFEAYTRGFVGEVGKNLNKIEIATLAFGAILMTYECGMRFLTDHLDGDTYFKVHRENHNLDRTRTQIKMIKDMELQLVAMDDIVAKYC